MAKWWWWSQFLLANSGKMPWKCNNGIATVDRFKWLEPPQYANASLSLKKLLNFESLSRTKVYWDLSLVLKASNTISTRTHPNRTRFKTPSNMTHNKSINTNVCMYQGSTREFSNLQYLNTHETSSPIIQLDFIVLNNSTKKEKTQSVTWIMNFSSYLKKTNSRSHKQVHQKIIKQPTFKTIVLIRFLPHPTTRNYSNPIYIKQLRKKNHTQTRKQANDRENHINIKTLWKRNKLETRNRNYLWCCRVCRWWEQEWWENFRMRQQQRQQKVAWCTFSISLPLSDIFFLVFKNNI